MLKPACLPPLLVQCTALLENLQSTEPNFIPWATADRALSQNEAKKEPRTDTEVPGFQRASPNPPYLPFFPLKGLWVARALPFYIISCIFTSDSGEQPSSCLQELVNTNWKCSSFACTQEFPGGELVGVCSATLPAHRSRHLTRVLLPLETESKPVLS